MIHEIPKTLRNLVLLLVALALLPFAVIAFARTFPSKKPPIHLIQDMDNQAKFRAQHANPFFADGRAMRPPVDGTVARGELQTDEHFQAGRVEGGWAADFPAAVGISQEFVELGRNRFNIYCLPCHGPAGYGDGVVNTRAKQLLTNTRRSQGTSWVPPANLHAQAISNQPVGRIYNTIANGLNTMPAYGPQIPTRDRWAIVAYVKALQRSQNAQLEDVPANQRDAIPETMVAEEEAQDSEALAEDSETESANAESEPEPEAETEAETEAGTETDTEGDSETESEEGATDATSQDEAEQS